MVGAGTVKRERQEMKLEGKTAASAHRRKHGFYSEFKERVVGKE